MTPQSRPRALGAAFVLAALVWPCLAATVDAGQHKIKWWRSEMYQRELALTPDQVTRIEHIFQESWPALQDSKHELDRLEQELSKVIGDGTADESQVVALIDRVEASRSGLGRVRSLMLYRIHRVLTPVQRERLKALHEERNRRERDGAKSSR